MKSHKAHWAMALGVSMVCGSSVLAAGPTAEQALQLQPIQENVNYQTPDANQIPKCNIGAEKVGEAAGWVVTGPNGERLRVFLDTNNDKKVDFWAYYKDGVEVYRDVDTDFNGKADQYRWLGMAGTRWGLDKDEDGLVDQWKMISAEEVSAELVEAAKTGDADRFAALLPTDAEFQSLGLTGERAQEVADKIDNGAEEFVIWARQQKLIDKGTKWVHFGATRPGIVPAGTEGVSKDLVVYENAIAMLDKAGEHSQLELGTLVRIGDAWRLIGAPAGDPGAADLASNPQGYFFSVSYSGNPAAGQAGMGVGGEIQEILTSLEELDQKMAQAASADQREKLAMDRIEVIKKVIAAANDDEMRENWIKQLADALSGGIQTGELSQGLGQLQSLADQVEKRAPKSDLAAYVRFREMSAGYTQQFQDPKADYAKIQEAWLAKLEGFIDTYPKSPDAAEAMMQLAIAHEFAGEEENAKKWYARIRTDFSGTVLGDKANGAIRRLDAVGKPFVIRGTTVDGKKLDSSGAKGSALLVHYWATWCEPCKEDMDVIRQMQAKYGARGFQVVGVSLDSSQADLKQFLTANRLAWPQLYEEGGLDSRYALEMGVLTLPTMILVGPDGKVISRSLHISQLDTELGKLIK
ncbi:Thiol-disulfide oxidoreductase ResA [Bremerella volcania]|uniref:Thiol-disulfide oxidoreductase ResA n=1 Tax=Bremerella volcania TaxID=2527984 RepID=A0A518C7P1_9BACT|nr:redoxin domain-containing protein [Bremerella volcania]QDU75234.1 Thiol-disulfide oxidoreductase ResA [Bremerella volcania]